MSPVIDLTTEDSNNGPSTEQPVLPADHSPNVECIQVEPTLTENPATNQGAASAENVPVDTKPSHALETVDIEESPMIPKSRRSFLPVRDVSRLAQHSLLWYWWQEIIACAIMVSALSGAILVLGLYENRALPKWPFSITPNSLISVFVVIMKATMLAILASGLGQTKWLWFKNPRPLSQYTIYDKAPQGPKYAAQLLWILRGRQLLASCAVIVIIIAIALDPFTQQVIHYRDAWLLSASQQATLPRTSYYSEPNTHLGAGESTIVLDGLGALMAGFYIPDSDSYDVSVSHCYTGNCTFDRPYSSLAMCSTCGDLSDQLLGTCYNSSTWSGQDGTSPWTCNYTLPSNTSLSVSAQEFFVASPPDSSEWFVPATSLFYREFISRNSVYPACSNPDAPCQSCHGSSCTGVIATGCTLYPCIRTYTASVLFGYLNETIHQEIPLEADLDNNCYTNLKTSCLSPQDWSLLHGVGITRENSAAHEYINFCKESEQDIFDNITTACIWELDGETANSYNNLFTSFLIGSLVTPSSYPGYDATDVNGTYDLLSLFRYGEYTQAIANQTFFSVADKITAVMRTSKAPGSDAPALGNVWQDQTVIHVEWVWLGLPLALVGLTLIFFVGTVIETSVGGREPYQKTFSLALLLTGVAGEVSDQFEDLKYLHELEKDVKAMRESEKATALVDVAKESMVQMRQVGTDWRLVKI